MGQPENTDGPTRTIQDVLADLETIIEHAIEEPSRLGYFAALYRKVTEQVKLGIEKGDFFEDGERMERLDVVFADRYLDALRLYKEGGEPTAAWRLAFEASGRRRLLILQQLLVGINAHINLDLGIAAAEIAPGEELGALKEDFDRINEILFSMIGAVEDAVGSISPGTAWLRRLGGKVGDVIIRFSLSLARDGAWRLARRLAPRPREEWPPFIDKRDRGTVDIGEDILAPGPFLKWGLLVIRLFESNDIVRNIKVLEAIPLPPLDEVERRRLARAEAVEAL